MYHKKSGVCSAAGYSPRHSLLSYTEPISLIYMTCLALERCQCRTLVTDKSHLYFKVGP